MKYLKHSLKNYYHTRLQALTVNNNSEILVIAKDSFQDAFVELLFVGDIDIDGKLDLIFETKRNYEEKRVILFLSSEADENQIIRNKYLI